MFFYANKDVKVIRGNYVTFENEDFVCRKGAIVVRDGVISDIKGFDAKVDGADYEVTLSDKMVIFPGLADLHTHHTYNMLPVWKRPIDTPWDNRYEWRNSREYKPAIKDKQKLLADNWDIPISNEENITVGDMLLYFAELQALAGGTTVLQEDTSIHVPDNQVNDSNCLCDDEFEHVFRYNFLGTLNGVVKSPHLLLRGTGCVSELGIDSTSSDKDQIYSVVDLFAPDFGDKGLENPYPYIDTSAWRPKEIGWKNVENYLRGSGGQNVVYKGVIAHLAEGRAGNLCPNNRRVDAYCNTEIDYLKNKLNVMVRDGIKIEDIQKLHMSIIHGCGINLNNKEVYELLKQYKIGVIWSPVSNLLLYDDTPDFYENIQSNEVILGLGSDWSPSGSKHVWDECKFAEKYLISRGHNPGKVRKDVLKMVTVNAAKLIGTQKIGTIEINKFADFFVLKSEGDIHGDVEKALEAFYSLEDERVELVMIAGTPIYGEKNYFDNMRTEYGIVPTHNLNLKSKAVYWHKNWKVKMSFEEMYDSLIKILKTNGVEASKFRTSEDKEYRDVISELEGKYVVKRNVVSVDSATIWNDTGLEINTTNLVNIKYIGGSWNVSPGMPYSDGLGINVIAKPGYLLPDYNEGCLVGKVGNGEPFYVGNQLEFSGEKGRLYLAANDDVNGLYGVGYTDNIGALDVEIKIV